MMMVTTGPLRPGNAENFLSIFKTPFLMHFSWEKISKKGHPRRSVLCRSPMNCFGYCTYHIVRGTVTVNTVDTMPTKRTKKQLIVAAIEDGVFTTHTELENRSSPVVELRVP